MNTFRKFSIVFALLIGCARVKGMPLAPPVGERERWLSEYETLKNYTATSFANFEFRVEKKHIDLSALDHQTRQSLAVATTRLQAQHAISVFIEAFDDGHFIAEKLETHSSSSNLSNQSISADATWQAACAAMGVRDFDRPFVDWVALSAFRPRPSGVFQTGFLSAGAKRLAVVRIPIFSGAGYPSLCRLAWESRRPTDCDEACQNELRQSFDQLMLNEFAQVLRELAEQKPDGLLLDLTNNGGGSSVVEAMVRQLTPQKIPVPARGFIHQPHWVAQFEEAANDFRKEAALPDQKPFLKSLLTRSAERAKAAANQARRPCDASHHWKTSAPSRACSSVSTFEPYLSVDEQPLVKTLESRGHLFAASQYDYVPGVWNRPVFLALNQNSASATEEVAAMLQDHAGVKVLGVPSAAIGCGYTNGGTSLMLPSFNLKIRAPDCIRYRADGSSESNGITPDVLVPWVKGDDLVVRARKLDVALNAFLRSQ
jgi:Peptidase family S41